MLKTGHKIMTHKFTKNISCMIAYTLSTATSLIVLYKLYHSYKHN